LEFVETFEYHQSILTDSENVTVIVHFEDGNTSVAEALAVTHFIWDVGT